MFDASEMAHVYETLKDCCEYLLNGEPIHTNSELHSDLVVARDYIRRLSEGTRYRPSMPDHEFRDWYRTAPSLRKNQFWSGDRERSHQDIAEAMDLLEQA